MINFKLPKKGKRYKMLKTAYFKPIYDKETFALTHRDFLLCTIKDIDTNETILRIFIEPEIDFYMVKEEYRDEIKYPLISIPIEKVEKHTCKYKNRDRTMLELMGLWKEASMIKRSNYRAYLDYIKDNVKNSPHFYASDTNIEDFYKTDFEFQYGTHEIFPLRKGFFDIEVDIEKRTSTINNPCTPINFITYYCSYNKIMHIYLLKYPDILEQIEIENDSLTYFKNYILNQGIDDLEVRFDIRFFDTEVNLIRSFFATVHDEKIDFLAAWNSRYDNKYILNRCSVLGINIPELFCLKDLPDDLKRVEYIDDPDRTRKNDETKKYWHRMWDWINCANYTMFVDSLSLFSNLRKRNQFDSYALYNVANMELGVTKVDLTSFGLTIFDAFRKDYKRFLQYSIMDTYLLHLLDEKNGDLESLVLNSENSRIFKGVNVSVVIKNTLYLYMMRKGLVIGNSIDYNIWESIPGAVVASIEGVNVKSSSVYGENKTMVFDNCIDLDASSLYPSIIFTLNACKNTIKKRYLYLYNDNPNNKVMDGAEFFQALETIESSILDLGEKIFNLPSIDNMVEYINKEIKE